MRLTGMSETPVSDAVILDIVQYMIKLSIFTAHL